MKKYLVAYLLCWVLLLGVTSARAQNQGPQGGMHPGGMPKDGPFVHEIWSATSGDGLVWKEDGVRLLEHASVPAALVRGDGAILLYFVDAEIKPSSVNVALSTDQGKTFAKQAFKISGLPENTVTVDPCPVRLSDGRIRLYFFSSNFGMPMGGPGMGPGGPQKQGSMMTGSPAGKGPGGGQPGGGGDPAHIEGDHKIDSAISTDGISFTYEGTAFTYPGLVDPDVFYTGTDWLMYVMSLGNGTVVARSSEGKNFEYEGVMEPRKWGTTAAIRLADGRFRLYAFKQGEQKSFHSLISTDGVNWTPEPGTRLQGPPDKEITDPFVIQLKNGSWKMFYKIGPGKK